MKKIRVGLIFGGKSVEHEVSLQSAKNIYDALDKNKYDVILIGIDKKGKWYLNDSSTFLLNIKNPKLISLNTNIAKKVTFIPGKEENQLVNSDVIFPILHGTNGEDGTLQGFLKLLNIPFVGSGVLGSALGMDKDVMKRLLRQANLPIAKFLVYKIYEKDKINLNIIKKTLDLPVFVKPANLGSSVGVSKVKNEYDFKKAIDFAFEYDNKILIEQYIKGREIECSVLGNENPIASLPGEIISKHEFYSYDAKYIDENGALLKIPADLPKNIVKKIQKLAIETFKTLSCEGMARVDFFLTNSNKIIINEINTIPGFTKISMYPKLWEVSGISYTELINKLIELAIDRFNKEQKLKTTII